MLCGRAREADRRDRHAAQHGLPRRARAVTLDDLLGQLADLVAERVAARLNGTGTAPPRAASPPEVLLTPAQVAQRLGVSRRFVYAHREQLGGRALSRRALRFPEAALARYLARRP